MGKCDSYIIQKILLLRLHYHLLLWSIQRVYYAASNTFKIFEIFDSAVVDSSDDEDEMGYLFESSVGEIDW